MKRLLILLILAAFSGFASAQTRFIIHNSTPCPVDVTLYIAQVGSCGIVNAATYSVPAGTVGFCAAVLPPNERYIAASIFDPSIDGSCTPPVGSPCLGQVGEPVCGTPPYVLFSCYEHWSCAACLPFPGRTRMLWSTPSGSTSCPGPITDFRQLEIF